MSRSLPPSPSLEHLRNEAKALLKAHKRADPQVCGRLRALRRFAGASDEEILAAPLSLQETQFALALAYGFSSWKELKQRVEESAPPIRKSPAKRWYHGSSARLDTLRPGSTVTPIVELARAFAHKPANVPFTVRENTDEGWRRVVIQHDGSEAGYLYEVTVGDPAADLKPHAESRMAPGEEMVTTRGLPVRLLEELPAGADAIQEITDTLGERGTCPAYDVVVYGRDDQLPEEAEHLFREELADSRHALPEDRPDRDRWRFACVCAITPAGHVLGGVHFDMGPVNSGPLADEKIAILERVLVRPEYRRLGVATRLLGRALAVAKEAGCAHMRCNANWSNPAEIALYKKCGFALADIGEDDQAGEYFTVRPL